MFEIPAKMLKTLATPAGLEPATTCLEGRKASERLQAFEPKRLHLPTREYQWLSLYNVNGNGEIEMNYATQLQGLTSPSHGEFGNPLNTTWISQPRSKEEREHLQAGGTVYGYGWSWRSSNGSDCSMRIGPYFDPAVGEREFLHALFEAGYRLPKWWEISRWGEKRLEKDRRAVIQKLETIKAGELVS